MLFNMLNKYIMVIIYISGDVRIRTSFVKPNNLLSRQFLLLVGYYLLSVIPMGLGPMTPKLKVSYSTN